MSQLQYTWNKMKIINKKLTSTVLSKDVIYYFDSLGAENQINDLFILLSNNGYDIEQYRVNYLTDYADDESSYDCYDLEELIGILNEHGMVMVKNIAFTSKYNGNNLIGTIYPETSTMCLSMPQK